MRIRLFPDEHLIYLTPLPLDEVMLRLEKNIDREAYFRFGYLFQEPEKPYEGWILGHRFSMQRIIDYRNASQPRIDGVVHHKLGKVLIHVNIHLAKSTRVMITVLGLILGLFSLSIVLPAFANGELEWISFAPILLWLVIYGMTIIGYPPKSRAIKEDLQKKFQAEVIEG